MALSDKNLVSLVAAEHIGPNETGDNIDAKRAAGYVWNPDAGVAGEWERMVQPTFTGDLTVDSAPTFKEDPSDTMEDPKYGHVSSTGDVQVDVLSLPNGVALETKQDDEIALLTDIDAKDFATQTTLALIKAKTDNLDVALSTVATNQTNGSQLTQLVDDDGAPIGVEEIGSQIYLNTAFVQDIEIATTNCSTTNIGSGVTFTGTSFTTLGVAAVQISLFADQPCTIRVQQAQEDPGVNWDVEDSWNYSASSGGNDAARTIQATGASFRVRVTNNGPSATTVFRLQATCTPYADALPRGLSQQGNLKVSLEELNATDISTGNGTSDDGTQRVAIASNNSPIPTSVSSLPLPSGASTSALQGTGNTSLSSIDTKLSGTLATSLATVPQATLPSAPKNNQVTVTTAGTRVQLGSNTLTVGVIIQALSTNTGLIYVGDSSVSASNGFELQAGQATSIGVTNTNSIWIDTSVNGSKICFIGS